MKPLFEEALRRARDEWRELHDGRAPLILVGAATCGRSAGALDVLDAFRSETRRLGMDARIVETGCLGPCYAEPIACVLASPNPLICYGDLDRERAARIVLEHVEGGRPAKDLALGSIGEGRADGIPDLFETPGFRLQVRRVLGNCGFIDPCRISHSLANGGYAGFLHALELGPERVIGEIKASGLRGRGGAGFPTWQKWRFCRDAKGSPKYLICNADEGDPGAFMNRSLLEGDPHSVIEGMLIAGFALGASEGTIYCRAEYPLALERLDAALGQARETGLFGADIFGSGFDFNFKIKEGAGAFVCGEETALISSIEGGRGMPRPRPPFPAASGLWGKPTIINNVETLASVALILRNGAEWFAGQGTAEGRGTKTFSLVGKVKRPGLVEVPLGISLRSMIEEVGGGAAGGGRVKAVQTGGPSGGCIPGEKLDTPVDYESLKAAGSIMGSGGMVVMDDSTCMVDFARFFLDFAQKESCGECAPCRLGTRQLLRILEDVTRGKGSVADLGLLREIGEGVRKAALCGLGQTAPNPVLTALRYFPGEFDDHVRRKKCPAAVCKELVSSPCQHVCPIGTEAPVYIAHLAAGRIKEAYEAISRDNPLPSMCARVCHHPCESKCQAGKWGSPIAIRALKRFAADFAASCGMRPAPPAAMPSGPRVAIAGSGPSGLMAAFRLARMGYRPTVFEAEKIAGGAPALYIPEYRLPRLILDAEIGAIESCGVEIITGTRVGKDLPAEAIRKEFAAFYAATGAHKPKRLGLPGEDAHGVMDALSFLKEVKLGMEPGIRGRVGVVGGGNAAVDAARTAARLGGVESVTVIYRRTREEMTAFRGEVDAAAEEGIGFEFLAVPSGIDAKGGVLKGVRCGRMRLGSPDESGRRRPVPVEGEDFEISLDSLLVAIGGEPDGRYAGGFGVAVGADGRIPSDPETFATSVGGVFAGGDAVTGTLSVIDAMAAGKAAAEIIDKFVRGEPVRREYRPTRPSVFLPAAVLTEEEMESAARPVQPSIPLPDRMDGFAEVEGGLSREDAVREARRCLRCDLETEDAKKALLDAKHG